MNHLFFSLIKLHCVQRQMLYEYIQDEKNVQYNLDIKQKYGRIETTTCD